MAPFLATVAFDYEVTNVFALVAAPTNAGRRFSQNLPIFGIKSLFQISCRPCENSLLGSVQSRGQRFFVIFPLCAIVGLEIRAAIETSPSFRTLCKNYVPMRKDGPK